MVWIVELADRADHPPGGTIPIGHPAPRMRPLGPWIYLGLYPGETPAREPDQGESRMVLVPVFDDDPPAAAVAVTLSVPAVTSALVIT